MKKMSEIKVTQFENIRLKSHRQISLFDELRNIKNGAHKDLIIKCREAVRLNEKETYVKLKEQLPAVTFCGEFQGGHKVSDLVHYNNLVVIDVDYIDILDLQQIKDILCKDKFILSLWLSPSGAGLKGLVKTDNEVENHKLMFNALRRYFFENYSIELDKSGSDISRLCFTSWDENIFYNQNSAIFNLLEEDNSEKIVKKNISINVSLTKSAYATEGLNKFQNRETMKKVLKFLYKKNISITGDYYSWVKVALAISYTFSYDVGEKYFLNLCRLDYDKHDETNSINLLKYCYNKRDLNTTNVISFATIIYFAKQAGFKLVEE